jgi:hypothetical protein
MPFQAAAQALMRIGGFFPVRLAAAQDSEVPVE